jgi:hypothetical protein
MSNQVEIKIHCIPEDAQILALFLERANFNDYAALASDETEAFSMLNAGERIRAALSLVVSKPA